MLLNEYADLIPTLPMCDSHVHNFSSTHGLLIGYSGRRRSVLPWSRIQVEPYDMSSIILGWYQINALDFVALFGTKPTQKSKTLKPAQGGWILCEGAGSHD